MSKSKPEVKNPVERWIKFKAGTGKFIYWSTDQEAEIEIPLPLQFIVLDELSKISGYNKANDCGIFSNEVRSTKKEPFRVQTYKGGEEISGYYTEVKEKIAAMGGKFTKSVYAALITMEGLELVNIELRGSAFSAWLEKRFDPQKFTVTVEGIQEGQTGTVTYKMPVFSPSPLDPVLDRQAVKMDMALQEHFRAYFQDQDQAPDDTDEIDEMMAKWKESQKVTEPEDAGSDLPF